MRYALGVAAAILSGIAINTALLVQSTVVGRVSKEAPLMRSLLRDRLWVTTIVLQLAIGSPLYMLAVGLIGPAIVPGLMAVGLVVLVAGSVIVRKESLSRGEVAGICLVMGAVAAFGLSRLSIDVLAYSMLDVGLLVRFGAFVAVLAAAAVGCSAAARPVSERASALHAASAGTWYVAGNMGLGYITAGFARFTAGVFLPWEICVFLAASALAVVGNVYGVAETQHSMAHGRTSVAVPLQNGISQIMPVLSFFLVYHPYTPTAASFAFLGAAVGLLVTGMLLLTARLARSRGEGGRGASPGRSTA